MCAVRMYGRDVCIYVQWVRMYAVIVYVCAVGKSIKVHANVFNEHVYV